MVRLGIDAPQDVKVHREEVCRALEQVNRESAGADATVAAELSKRLVMPPKSLEP